MARDRRAIEVQFRDLKQIFAIGKDLCGQIKPTTKGPSGRQALDKRCPVKRPHSARNIGVDWHKITSELKKFCEDSKYWLEHNTYASWDELGVRFHHRLVCIHPFPNGNGTHARLMTDLLLKQNGQPIFTWGAHFFGEEVGRKKDDVRQSYLEALRDADLKKFDKLNKFVRS